MNPFGGLVDHVPLLLLFIGADEEEASAIFSSILSLIQVGLFPFTYWVYPGRLENPSTDVHPAHWQLSISLDKSVN